MKKLTNFRMDVWTDGNEKKVSFHANIHTADGPKNLIFYFIQENTFTDFCMGRGESFKDLSYNISSSGDSFVYYIFELPNRETGKAQIPFAHIHFPIRFRKVLLRLVKGLWAKHAEQCRVRRPNVPDKITVLIDDERLYRMEKSYSSESGNVIVEVKLPSNFTEEQWEKLKSEEPELQKHLDRTLRLAKSYTHSYLDTVKLEYRFTHCHTVVDYFLSKRFKQPDGDYREYMFMPGGIVKREASEDGAGHRWSGHS